MANKSSQTHLWDRPLGHLPKPSTSIDRPPRWGCHDCPGSHDLSAPSGIQLAPSGPHPAAPPAGGFGRYLLFGCFRNGLHWLARHWLASHRALSCTASVVVFFWRLFMSLAGDGMKLWKGCIASHPYFFIGENILNDARNT